MHCTSITADAFLGRVEEIRTAAGVLDLGSPAFRLVGLVVALHGRLCVRAVNKASSFEKRLGRGAAFGAGGRLPRTLGEMLNAPATLFLRLARRVLARQQAVPV
jgi:hypothetical protein